jgi:subtilisin family serine protease
MHLRTGAIPQRATAQRDLRAWRPTSASTSPLRWLQSWHDRHENKARSAICIRQRVGWAQHRRVGGASAPNLPSTSGGRQRRSNGYTCDGERWWGSNYGTTVAGGAGAVDVIAPTILPTTDRLGAAGYDPSDYSKWFNGTSCATPYAAGVCALIKSKNPTWTPSQVRTQLLTTAQDVTSVESGTGWDRYAGYGMVDAAAAVGGAPPADQITHDAPTAARRAGEGTRPSPGPIVDRALRAQTNSD